jgi:2-dehydro-3-deoxyphosphogluconate aldolase/(4S)-4-hydroxy-2-oxoglutarate aldolase
MTSNQEIVQRLKAQGVLPLYYHQDPSACLSVAASLYRAGIRCIEFTNRGAQAFDNFKMLVQKRNADMPDLLLAIGTIRTSADAERFHAAGADLLISPVFDESVANATARHDALWIPGCLSPTEIHRAEQHGCKLVKIFPGNLTGPSYIDAVRPIFPEMEFIVTGGVEGTEENLGRWFRSGVAGVGMGSKLIPTDKEWTTEALQELEDRTKELLSVLEKARKKI